MHPTKGTIMSFRDNLQHLRATRNMTQEQLAMLMGVSRQSVTKWEAERAYPEMDKLIKLTQIFDCTIDELVSGDLTGRTPETARSIPATAALADVCGYDEHKIKLARNIALGAAIVLLGAGGAAFLEGMTAQLADPDAGSVIAMFGCAAIGLALIIPAVISDSAYQKSHPFVEDFYTSEQKDQVRRAFGYELTAGIAVILLSAALNAGFESRLADAFFFVGAAIGVFLIVHAVFLVGRIDVEDYNIGALSELNEEEVASIVGEERAANVLAKIRKNRWNGALCGIIMIVATILGIVSMFWGRANPGSFLERFFWIWWVVGGLLCAIVSIALSMQDRG